MDWDDLGTWEDEEIGPEEQTHIFRGKVVGVSFAKGYPDTLKYLHDNWNGPIRAQIKRNPDNPYDTNACEVWIGEVFIGHIARDLAAVIAPLLDMEVPYELNITSIGFAKNDPEKPGAGFQLEIE